MKNLCEQPNEGSGWESDILITLSLGFTLNVGFFPLMKHVKNAAKS